MVYNVSLNKYIIHGHRTIAGKTKKQKPSYITELH